MSPNLEALDKIEPVYPYLHVKWSAALLVSGTCRLYNDTGAMLHINAFNSQTENF
jgi:hypothetical protein